MADTKLTALTETTSPALTDDVYVVTTPGGTPASKRSTISNLRTAMLTLLRSGSTTDGHLAVWNGSNAESLKDGGVVLSEGAWTDYSSTSTVVGWASFVTKDIHYKQIGKIIFVSYILDGTSNSTTTTFTLPATSASSPSSYLWVSWAVTGATNALGVAILNGNASTVGLYNTPGAGNWPNNGVKTAQGQFWYVAA